MVNNEAKDSKRCDAMQRKFETKPNFAEKGKKTIQHILNEQNEMLPKHLSSPLIANSVCETLHICRNLCVIRTGNGNMCKCI